MDTDTKINLAAPEEFAFPFDPYPIQVDFMKHLYTALEGGKFGIFESPTGTGKSMSVICGSLKWLHDHEKRQKDELELMIQHDEAAKKKAAEAAADDWIAAFAAKKEVEDEHKEYREHLELRLKKEARLNELRNNARPTVNYKRKYEDLDKEFHELFKDLPKDENSNRLVEETPDEDTGFVVEEYHSDEEKTTEKAEEEEGECDDHVTKIYFCSRTHSQLAQFVREVKRSPYSDNTRVITLSSRQNTCINDTILRLRSLSLINEKCLDMQKNKSETVEKVTESGKRRKLKLMGKCPYYNQEKMYDLRDQLLVETVDVEESVVVGRRMNACPYYANRYAVPAAQLVALPYNVLLHAKTRAAFGVNLKDQIVIVDEAHNLVETINNAHSVEVNVQQLQRAHSQLSQYLGKYRARLLAKNLLYIRQILFILDSCFKILKPQDSDPQQSSVRLLTVLDFVNELGIDNINLFKLLKYCQKSQISKKLHGFVEKYRPPLEVKKETIATKEPSKSGLQKYLDNLSQTGKNEPEVELEASSSQKQDSNPVMSSPLMHIEGFLDALTSTDDDGRILITKSRSTDSVPSSMKYLLMNPAVHFESVVRDARAVIVAGGTMQPVSEFKDQLCYSTGVVPERILEFSCGHVIPSENLLPVALSAGPSGLVLDFTFQNRDQPKLLDELGRVIINLCKIVPGGVVLFFPSYEYENKVVQHWQKTSVSERIAKSKQLFQEPKKANQCDNVLKKYSNLIQHEQKGAILLCVVGGKMSEGINFSDDLGRCIVMVGLPYPNRFSPELKEKMEYLNKHYPKSEDGRLPGQVHYENLCMKAVNQSIGRAIRHRGDYASIVLLDQRYSRPHVVSKLPTWISKHVVKHEKFGPAFAAVGKFFAGKKKLTSTSN